MSYPRDRVFTIVGQQIVASRLMVAGCTQCTLAGFHRLARHVQPFSGTELFLAADVFTVEWRVMENTAIPQHQPLVHHKPFAPRHYVAG
jgi:hypothetical protein